MHAIAHRAWAPLATIVVAMGVHAVIVASLPKGRPPLSLTTPVTVAADAPAPQVPAVVPSIAAPEATTTAPAARPSKSKLAAQARAAVVVSRKKAAPRDEKTTTPAEDEAPVSFDTPLPVTIVVPPANTTADSPAR